MIFFFKKKKASLQSLDDGKDKSALHIWCEVLKEVGQKKKK